MINNQYGLVIARSARKGEKIAWFGEDRGVYVPQIERIYTIRRSIARYRMDFRKKLHAIVVVLLNNDKSPEGISISHKQNGAIDSRS